MNFNYFQTRYRIYKIKETATPFFKSLQEYFTQAVKELVIDKNTNKPITIEELNDIPKENIYESFMRNLKHTPYYEEFLYTEGKIGKRNMKYFVMGYFEHMLIKEYYKKKTGRNIAVSRNIFEVQSKYLYGIKTKYYSDTDGKQCHK